MLLKLFRHISISLIAALICALILFKICLSSGVIFSPYFILVGIFIAISALLTPHLSIFLRNIISIAAILVFYYLFTYLIYLETQTNVPSVLEGQGSFERGWFYLKNSTYSDLKDFWPNFKVSINILDLLFALGAVEGLLYFGWKSKLLRSSSLDLGSTSENNQIGNTFRNRRKVNSKRFKRRF